LRTRPMNAKLGPYKIAWLSEAEDPADAGEIFSCDHVDYDLSPNIGKAWVERLELGNGIQLFHGYHDLEPAPRQLFPLIDVEIHPDTSIFCVQTWVSGSANHREYWQGRSAPPVDIVSRPGRDTFRYHRYWSASVMVEGGIVSEMYSMAMEDATLRSLLGEQEMTDLLKNLGLGAGRVTEVRSMPIHMSFSLREAMSSRFTGTSRRLFSQSRLLEYLANLYSSIVHDENLGTEKPHVAKIRELRDHLLTFEGKIPNLNHLSAEFNLPARRLNAEFMREYGQSIFSFVTDHRLQQAHAAITQSPIAMKVLAARLGYSHVNHFISAFRKKFGYAPGSLRNQKMNLQPKTRRSEATPR